MNLREIFKIDIKELYFKFFKLKKDRFHLFTYISQGLKNGSTMTELLQSIARNYQHRNPRMHDMVTRVIYYMEELGDSEAEAMYKAGLINEMEKNAVDYIFQSEPYKAMEYLNNKISNEDNLRWAILMLFSPTILILFLYIVFQPEIKDLTDQMLAPVNDLSLKKIEVPDWFKDRVMFTEYLLVVFGIMGAIFGFVEFLKRKNIPLLFKLFKIKEREFVLNNFEVIQSLLKSGLSLMRAVELVASRKQDYVSSKIFSEIREAMIEGDKNMYEILERYNIDSATVSYIMSGEMNNSLDKSIASVVMYNRERYEQLVKKLSKYLPLTGEIIMTFIILIPLIDILNVTTIGVLDFQI